MDLKKKGSTVSIPDRHGHLITPGSAEGEREVIEQALINQQTLAGESRRRQMADRQRSGREMRRDIPQQAGNRKKRAA